jgi:hypothetical protein
LFFILTFHAHISPRISTNEIHSQITFSILIGPRHHPRTFHYKTKTHYLRSSCKPKNQSNKTKNTNQFHSQSLFLHHNEIAYWLWNRFSPHSFITRFRRQSSISQSFLCKYPIQFNFPKINQLINNFSQT